MNKIKWWHIILALFALIIITNTFKSDQEKAREEAERDSLAREEAKPKRLSRKDKIRRQFSSWDGSNRKLVEVVKRQMNDKGSFEHVKTVYQDLGKNKIFLIMDFRGKNDFGAMVLNKAYGTLDISTGEIKDVTFK